MLCWRFLNFPIHQTMERQEKSWKHFVNLNREQRTRKWRKNREMNMWFSSHMLNSKRTVPLTSISISEHIFIEHQNSRSSWELEKSRALLCVVFTYDASSSLILIFGMWLYFPFSILCCFVFDTLSLGVVGARATGRIATKISQFVYTQYTIEMLQSFMTRARILNSLWRHDGCLRRFTQ